MGTILPQPTLIFTLRWTTNSYFCKETQIHLWIDICRKKSASINTMAREVIITILFS